MKKVLVNRVRISVREALDLKKVCGEEYRIVTVSDAFGLKDGFSVDGAMPAPVFVRLEGVSEAIYLDRMSDLNRRFSPEKKKSFYSLR